MSTDEPVVLIDDPAPMVRRITLNRPEKRNALNHDLRRGILDGLIAADQDPSVKVMIVRGAGKCFSAGYDLTGNGDQQRPYYTAEGDPAEWARHVEHWTQIWELGKPVIAQVHSYCLAGGSELATCCDLIYVAEDAQVGYPGARFSVPDLHFHPWFMGMRSAMYQFLTGDSISGAEAWRLGWANEAVPAEDLEARVLEVAIRLTHQNSDLLQLNKRAIHRQMEVMGLRTGLRLGTEMHGLGQVSATSRAFGESIANSAKLTDALNERDAKWGDYRRADTDTDTNDG
jgi:enoyl-CoA hydratase